MLFIFTGSLVLISFGSMCIQFWLKMRSLRSVAAARAPMLTAARYRPMLRLLSDDDLEFVSADPRLKSMLRAKRRDLFRGYLRCLTRDYAHLLAGVRLAMIQSGIDRPDLARALARNRVFFALAVCKVEFRLAMHAIGSGSVDISGLVDALEALRGQVNVLSSTSLATATQTA
jgi:hypothetical protein